MSSKNRDSESQAARLIAPFGVPRRKGMISDGGPGGPGALAIFLFAIRQKKKCIGDFLVPHRQNRCASWW
jgi:hypothetical protein